MDTETAARFDALEERLEARIERLAELVAKSFAAQNERLDRIEARLDRIEARLDGVEARLDGVETRLDGVETRLDGVEGRLERLEDRVAAMDLKFSERLITVDDRFRTLGLAIELFEGRITGKVDGALEQLDHLDGRVGRLEIRFEGVESELVNVNGRLDTLGDDVRQRFRVVH